MIPRRFVTWQFELLENALAAGTTIALRSSDAAYAAAKGKPRDAREANRMVAEKAEAFSAGMFAAGLEYQRQWWQTALSGSLAPADAWLHVVRAASQPARVTVRRNARRLSRRGR